ncbi:MAG: DUF4230 domain-containing protein [Coriobacteriia bacterium]|nr:DUF4230 domain-containing protein [Coriobacteriia bacterium]
MSDNNIKVSSTAKTVSNATTKRQEEELAAAKKKQQEANKQADAAKKAASTSSSSTAKKSTTTSTSTSSTSSKSSKSNAALEKQVEDLAADAVGGAVTALASSKTGGFLKGLIIGLLVGALAAGLVCFTLQDQLFGKVKTVKESADAVLDETFLGYTDVDFQNAVLGEATQHQELIVMEQPLEISSTITKAGLGNLSIFSKVKNVIYAGTGVYTVNLQNVKANNIAVDNTAKTVTVTVPHATLQYINPDYESMQFEDTEKGLLAFGDLSLTVEQQNELEKSVQTAMRERLEQDDLTTKADEFAQMKTWETFQPLVSAVSPQYKVVITFA